MTSIEEIRQIKLLEGFEDSTLEKIAEHLQSCEFSPGTPIFYRGDPGTCMFMIISGQVRISLTNEEGVEYTIATLDAGEVFGEMALLTGEPRSANVMAMGMVKVVIIDQDQFASHAAIQKELNARLLCLLANRLGKTTHAQHIQDSKNTEVIASLLSYSKPLLFSSFPGESRWAKGIQKRLDKLRTIDDHILIKGPVGTEKQLVGQLIHKESQRANRPLLTLDCANPPPVYRVNKSDPSDSMLLMAVSDSQLSALFGHEKGSTLFAESTRRGCLELADGGTLLLENIHALSSAAQTRLIGFMRSGCYSVQGKNVHSDVRIVATAGDGLDQLLEEEKFKTELMDFFSREQILLRPLTKRKKDIPIFAWRFLKLYERTGKPRIRGFSKRAIHALVDYEWPINVDGLEQVISRATAICDGHTIEEEHIFLDISPFSMSGKINLLKNQKLDDITQNQRFPHVIKLITVPVFLFLLFYCFFGPAENNLANIVVWSLWWPSLLLLTLLASRFWCSICPLQKLGDLSLFFRKKPFLPVIIKNYGAYFGMAGFVLILAAEHHYKMSGFPKATGFLLLALIMGLVFSNLIFGKRVWCRFFCPLGRMVSRFASLSLVELRSNINVCTTQCFTQDCMKDSNCPMGIHPSAAVSDHDCILCFSCAKKCTHKAVHLDARLPLFEVLTQKKLKMKHSVFAILILGAVLGEQLPPLFGSFSFLVYVTFFLVLCLLVSLLQVPNRRKVGFLVLGYSCLPLAFAGLFCLYFMRFLEDGHSILPLLTELLGLSRWIPGHLVTPNLVTLYALPPLFILLGFYTSWQMLKRLGKKHSSESQTLLGYKTVLLTTTLLLMAINLGMTNG